MDKSITITKKHYDQLLTVIMNGYDEKKELIETIRRMRDILDQQQGSTETIQRCVSRFLNLSDADYLQSGVMDAIDRGLFNSKIVPLNPSQDSVSGQTDQSPLPDVE